MPLEVTLIDWAQDQWCSLIMCPEGLVIEKEEGAPKSEDEKSVRVYGVGSTQKARDLIIEPNVLPFSEGVITGVAGILLNEGKRRNFDVISLLAEAQQDYPDARAAAKITLPEIGAAPSRSLSKSSRPPQSGSARCANGAGGS